MAVAPVQARGNAVKKPLATSGPPARPPVAVAVQQQQQQSNYDEEQVRPVQTRKVASRLSRVADMLPLHHRIPARFAWKSWMRRTCPFSPAPAGK